jgi:hypothetical protein
VSNYPGKPITGFCPIEISKLVKRYDHESFQSIPSSVCELVCATKTSGRSLTYFCSASCDSMALASLQNGELRHAPGGRSVLGI